MLDHIRNTALSITVLLILQSCMGTGFTRLQDGSFAGKYPYSAVGADAVMVKEAFGRPVDHGGGFALVGIISFPLDIVLDTILLPVDLIAWPFGFEKSWF